MSMEIDNYPLAIRKLDEKEYAEASKDINKDNQKFFVRVGPGGYLFSDEFLSEVADIYNMELRSDDIFVVSYPKAGTTWTQELVWMVANNVDYKTSNAIPLPKRFPYIEGSFFPKSEAAQALIKKSCGNDPKKLKIAESLSQSVKELLTSMPSPRFLKTHLPFSMLPPNILDKSKAIYVARDPRDVAVSFYHHHVFMTSIGYKGDFKSFWELFKKDMVIYAPYLSHLKEAWALKDHPNMLFLFYEELSKDIAAVIRRVAKFLNKTLTEEQIAGLCDHLSFANFKNNKSVNADILKDLGLLDPSKSFVRKGKAGGWRDYFDEVMSQEAEQWIADNLRGTNIRFTN